MFSVYLLSGLDFVLYIRSTSLRGMLDKYLSEHCSIIRLTGCVAYSGIYSSSGTEVRRYLGRYVSIDQ